jgi:hypothetical protein
VSLPHSSASDAPIHPSVPAMARANLASRELFSGVSSQVQYGRVVRCDKLNAVGATTGPERGVGICVGEMGKANGRSSVAPDNLGRDSSLRMTGCARARGDRDTLCVDGDTSPGARFIGGRSVDVLVAGVGASRTLAGGSKLPL